MHELLQCAYQSSSADILSSFFPNTSTQFGSTDMGEEFAVTVGKDILSKSNPIKTQQYKSISMHHYNVIEHLIKQLENPA